jgi:hypothetical protein
MDLKALGRGYTGDSIGTPRFSIVKRIWEASLIVGSSSFQFIQYFDISAGVSPAAICFLFAWCCVRSRGLPMTSYRAAFTYVLASQPARQGNSQNCH